MSTNIICCSVFDAMNAKVILPWTIMQVQDNDTTFRTYFERQLKQRISEGNCVLSSAHIGKSKEVLDVTELDLPVLSVIFTFGHYVRFKVQLCAVSITVVSTNSGTKNAYEILMSSARIQHVSQLPAKRPVHTNKHKRYNNILKFLHDHNLKWKQNVISSGENL